jgi:hypothetical protein
MAPVRNERTVLDVMMGGQPVGRLQACDQHGNGRSNKAWIGTINGEAVDLPNLKAVRDWAKRHGYTYAAPFEP